MATSQSNPPRDALLVAVLKLLPQRVRERFCYVTLGVALIAVAVGLWLFPVLTMAGGSGASMFYWLARSFGR